MPKLTYKMVRDLLGPRCLENAQAYNVFPRDRAELLLDSTFYEEIFTQHKKLKLLRVLSAAAAQIAKDRMLERIDQNKDQMQSDYVQAHARSQNNRVLTSKLSNKHNRMEPRSFVAWARFFCRLPQVPHLGGLREQKELDYHAEHCMGLGKSCNGQAIDLHGNHAHGRCASVSAGLHYKHKLLLNSVRDMAKTAVGSTGQVNVEPATSKVLQKQLTEKQCRSLFLKQPTKAQQKQTLELLQELQQHAALSEDKREHIEQKFREIEAGRKRRQKDCVGLRADLQIIDRSTHPATELLVDVTSNHPTCKSYIKGELEHTEHNVASELKTKGLPPDKRPHLVGYAVRELHQLKHSKYAPLMAMVLKQHLDRKRESKPEFIAGVCSTLGEFGPDMVKLQEDLTKMYLRRLQEEERLSGPRLDGYTQAQLTGIFRSAFKCNTQTAVAKGFARMLCDVGLPFGKVAGQGRRRAFA